MFSLKSLLLAMAVAAVYIAAFVNRSEVWAGVSVTMALALLGYGMFAIYVFPERRAFFVPAVMIGVLYGSAALIQPLGLNRSLVTTRLFFEWWYSGDEGDITRSVAVAMGGSVTDEIEKDLIYSMLTNPMDFYGLTDLVDEFFFVRSIGHCAVALILAVIAGLVGSYVARRLDVNARQNHVQT